MSSLRFIVGARPSELRDELVNMNCRQEPVHLKCSEGLVRVSNWALGAVALVAFRAEWRCSLSWYDS